MVPTPTPELLAASNGLLLNELCRSADTIIRPVLAIIRSALACDTGAPVDESGTDFNDATSIILFAARLGARIDNYMSFLLDWSAGMHESIRWHLRDLDVSEETFAKLQKGRTELRHLLHKQFNELFEDYLKKFDSQISSEPTNQKLIDRNTRLACDLHAHKLLFRRNFNEADMDFDAAKTLVGSFVFLTTRHVWNRHTKDGERIRVPETELYQLLQSQRRRLISWIASKGQKDLDTVMQTALQVSSSLVGSSRSNASPEQLDPTNIWSGLVGGRSQGRWVVGSTRTIDATTGAAPAAIGVAISAPKISELVTFDESEVVGQVRSGFIHLSALCLRFQIHANLSWLLFFSSSTTGPILGWR